MTASIDATDFTRALTNVRRVISGSLQKELTHNLHEAGPVIVADMKGSAGTRIQRVAASTVSVSRDSKGITLSGGKGGGLGATLFAGGEYGGRKPRKVAYVTRSPIGTPYIVRRKTTMQFAPHLGNTGYFFWPTMRDWLPLLYKEQQQTVDQTLGGGK